MLTKSVKSTVKTRNILPHCNPDPGLVFSSITQLMVSGDAHHVGSKVVCFYLFQENQYRVLSFVLLNDIIKRAQT